VGSARHLADEHETNLRAAFGSNLSPVKEAEIRHAAKLLAIADAVSTKIVDEGVDAFDKLAKAEDLAKAAVQALGVPQADKPKVTALEVAFVDGFSMELKRALDACAPRSRARVALAAAQSRVAELEGEVEAQRAAISQLRRKRAVPTAPAPTPPRSGNVVPLRSPPTQSSEPPSGAIGEATLV